MNFAEPARGAYAVNRTIFTPNAYIPRSSYHLWFGFIIFTA